MSIFATYYEDQPFVDRFASDPRGAVDVIIPVFHTNELWKANLVSIYREIPVRRMLISDGGCIDDSIEVVQGFPRVEVFDHRAYKTLGKCIAALIHEVTADWFVYLHSDVYLPPGWFDKMVAHQPELDWFGCPMNITVMVNYRLRRPERPYAGSQMGRKAAFAGVLDRIDDDFVYRQEDFVFKRIVEDNGFTEGKVEDTFHYHQLMYRPSAGFDLDIEDVDVKVRTKPHERRRALVMQVYGIVKYVKPTNPWLVDDFLTTAFSAVDEGFMKAEELDAFIAKHNPEWAKHWNRAVVRRRDARRRLVTARRTVTGWVRGLLERPRTSTT